MDWWLWILLGLALFAIEMLTPGGFYVLFFGAGAVAVGALVAAGVADSPSAQWLLFSLGSLGALLVFRKGLVNRFKLPRAGHEVDSFSQDTAVLLQDLPANGVGKAELRGTTWNVRNAEAKDLETGRRCKVERVDGLTLWVKAE